VAIYHNKRLFVYWLLLAQDVEFSQTYKIVANLLLIAGPVVFDVIGEAFYIQLYFDCSKSEWN